jgi:hypothetical protein
MFNHSRAMRRVSLSIALFATLIAHESAFARNGAAAPGHAPAPAAAPAPATSAPSTGANVVFLQIGDRDRVPYRRADPPALQPTYACGENAFCQQNALDAR